MKTAVARRRTNGRASKQALLKLLPEQGEWSEQRYLALTDSLRRLVEFSDGYIEVPPMPTVEHQWVLQRIFLLFQAFLEPRGGIVMFSPLRLQLRPGKIREPDLLLLQSKDDPRNQNRFWLGADLVLEVLSEDDRDRDVVVKRSEYAKAKITEYWIVDPRDKTIHVLALGKRSYRRHGVFKPGQSAASLVLSGFAIAVAAVFAK